MSKGSKVSGTYFGVKFSGTVVEVWGWSHKWIDGVESVFIDLDTPITVGGIERNTISWKPNRFSTIDAN